MAVSTNYEVGVDVDNLELEEVANFEMVEKIARQVIKNVTTEDILSVFDKLPVENGTTIEDAVVGLASATAFDRTAVDVFAKTTPNLVVRYFKNWTDLQFSATIERDEMRKVMLAGRDVGELADKIVSSLYESDKQDKYERMKGLFSWGVSEGVLVKATEVTNNDYKGILTALKDTVSGMTFVNDDFNSAGIKRRTIKDDIIILMPYTIKNKMDVNELASVFNLDKDKIDGRIIEIDEGSNIYVVDKNAILNYTRTYLMTNQWNPKALYWNYWLTTKRMYAITPLYDACYIKLVAPSETVTKIEITNTSNIPVGLDDTALEVTVANEGAIPVEIVNTEEEPVNTKEVTE